MSQGCSGCIPSLVEWSRAPSETRAGEERGEEEENPDSLSSPVNWAVLSSLMAWRFPSAPMCTSCVTLEGVQGSWSVRSTTSHRPVETPCPGEVPGCLTHLTEWYEHNWCSWGFLLLFLWDFSHHPMDPDCKHTSKLQQIGGEIFLFSSFPSSAFSQMLFLCFYIVVFTWITTTKTALHLYSFETQFFSSKPSMCIFTNIDYWVSLHSNPPQGSINRNLGCSCLLGWGNNPAADNASLPFCVSPTSSTAGPWEMSRILGRMEKNP